MAVEIGTRFINERYTYNSNGQSFIRCWRVTGATDAIDAAGAAGIPEYGDEYEETGLLVRNIDVEQEESYGAYFITATYSYSPGGQSDKPSDPAAGDEFVTLDFSGQTVNTKVAYSQDVYDPDLIEEVSKLIGVADDGTVEGVDVYAPAGQLVVTQWKNPDDVTSAFLASILGVYGTVNSEEYYEFAAGTLLFTGFRIANRAEELWELEFTFRISPNLAQADMPVLVDYNGETINFTAGKKGWEYMWVKEISKPLAGKKVSRIREAYIAQVYKTDDFTGLALAGTWLVS